MTRCGGIFKGEEVGRVMNKKGNFPKAKDNDNDMKIHGDGQVGGRGVKEVKFKTDFDVEKHKRY